MEIRKIVVIRESVLAEAGKPVAPPVNRVAGIAVISNPFAGRHWARIFEVTHDQPARKVWEIVIDDPTMGWAVYRSQRFPDLYGNL